VSDLSYVEVEGLGKTFEEPRSLHSRLLRRARRALHAVNDVSFSIDRGETFGLVGESGSGKSTVAKLVVGLLPATSGTVRIGGAMWEPIAARRALTARRRVQLIFQDPYASLDQRWRVDRIIAEPMKELQLLPDRHARKAKVASILTQVGLHPDDGRRFPHQFSGGQRQRIGIARALASEAEFLVCDEPTSALDVSVQAQILNLMRDLQRARGLTLLFISHNLAVVRHMARRIGVMYCGRFVEVATTEDLFRRPRHPYTRMLLDALPRTRSSMARGEPIAGETPSPFQMPSGCAFHPRCPRAVDRCRTEVPRLEAGVACHVPLA